MNPRVISAAGTAVHASMRIDSVSSCTTRVASGAFSAVANSGAAKSVASHSSPLQTIATVLTVGAMRETSPGQRTTARLTPSSLTLSSPLSATRATAYMP